MTCSGTSVSGSWLARRTCARPRDWRGTDRAVKNGKIGFARVGTGMAGQTHARELEFVADGELVAVCSRNEMRVREFADAFKVPSWYTDYRE